LVEDAIARTAANTGPQLVIALNYGAQDEILRAVRQLADEGGEIDKARFEGALYTRDLPPLDLLIRTSGEKRLSNFLLWQAAYAELLFVDTLWPDFGPAELKAAIDEFAARERRYGGL
jgi:undecaprenyl diphosphate synthase